MTFNSPAQMDGSLSSQKSKNSSRMQDNSVLEEMKINPFKGPKGNIKAFSPEPMLGPNKIEDLEAYDPVEEMIENRVKRGGSRLQSPSGYSNRKGGQNKYMDYQAVTDVCPNTICKDPGSYPKMKGNGVKPKKKFQIKEKMKPKGNFVKLGTTVANPLGQTQLVSCGNRRRNTKQIETFNRNTVVENIMPIYSPNKAGRNLRDGAISPTTGIKYNRAFSPSLISEYDENEEYDSDAERNKNKNKLLDQYKGQRNAVSPFLGPASRKLKLNAKVKNDFGRRMKSPLPGEKILPLIHQEKPPTRNQTIMGIRSKIESSNRSKNNNNTICHVKGISVNSRTNGNQFATISPNQKTNRTSKFTNLGWDLNFLYRHN